MPPNKHDAIKYISTAASSSKLIPKRIAGIKSRFKPVVRHRSLSPVPEDMQVDSTLDISNNNWVLHQTIDKKNDDIAQSTEFDMIDEHELPVLTEAAEKTVIMPGYENKSYKATEEAMCTNETTCRLTHILQLVPYSDATLVQTSESSGHQGSGAMTEDSNQYLSELFNQSAAGPSTPELPSGTSLEERCPTPISNKNVESNGLDNNEQSFNSSIGTDLTSVIEGEDVTLPIKLMVESRSEWNPPYCSVGRRSTGDADGAAFISTIKFSNILFKIWINSSMLFVVFS